MLEFSVTTAYGVSVQLFVNRTSELKGYAATMQELILSVQSTPPKIDWFLSQ